MTDQVVPLKLSGELLLGIIENGVSMWPKYDGRWPLISGFKFKFDPSLEPGKRVLPDSFVRDNGDPIEMDKEYTLACKNFLSSGKDGFVQFLDEKMTRLYEDANECPTI